MRNAFIRKPSITLLAILVLGLWAPVWASPVQFQKAVVVRVDKSQPTLPYRTRRSDTPPPPTEFDFDITFRVNCLEYVGRYATAIDFLPGTVEVNKLVDISIRKHVLYMKTRDGNEVKMEILEQSKLAGPCDAGH
jgi:hypothetical protein